MHRYFLNEQQVKRLYYKNEVISEENIDKLAILATDFLFLEGIHRFCRVQAEKGSASTYLYRFSFDARDSFAKSATKNMPDGKLSLEFKKGKWSGLLSYILGVCHCDELPYLFNMRAYEEKGLKCLVKGTQRYRIMEQLTEMWTNFATYG